mmetsp:Transcript_22843/g.30455  ORF Transcript_22843/g.30455 Transcript_22843/m.30455 type:complete len:91 (+) Transcript_22843:224-496(+)
MLSRINEKLTEEKQLQARQVENFTSTVSHEMRTPIASVLFFATRLNEFFLVLCAACQAHQKVADAKHYLNLIISQLRLTQSFVDDLTDLR